jgi:N-acetylmuramoyl-L-alanine amidase
MKRGGQAGRLGRIVCLIGFIGLLELESGWEAQAAPQKERTVCLDPGHQLRGNNEHEPIGPGAAETKPKVSSGTAGVKTKRPEYAVNLDAGLLLRDRLHEYGYRVVMTREVHEVNLSNRERAAVCNDAAADLAVRIHADGDSSSKTQGMTMLYPGLNKYTGGIHEESRRAAEVVLPEVIAATGAVSRGAVPRTDLSGFNWSEVPTILVEMGFMSNPREDELLSDPDYVGRMAQGLATGINKYLSEPVEGEPLDMQGEMVLSQPARLFELVEGRMLRTTLSLSPQTVWAAEVRGEWAKIDTWVGERWVHLQDEPSV